MDGFAVVAADLARASAERPVTLPLAGEVPAGDTREHRLEPGRCLRIMTGAPIPAGADAVVPVELTDGGDGQVTFRGPVKPGASVRLTGGDVRPGDLLLTAGTRIGRSSSACWRRPGTPRCRPPAAPGGGHLHRQRAGRARHAAGPRPDLGIQQRDAGRGGPGGRRDA